MMDPGFYWYLEANQPPTIVEVAKEEFSNAPHLYVYFVGTDCDAPLARCQGQFIGPLVPPKESIAS